MYHDTVNSLPQLMSRTAVILIVALGLGACAHIANAERTSRIEADTIFANAKVYTLEENQPWAEAVAVAGEKILYVGSAAGAEAYRGDNTDWVDLDGKMILPGFVSVHEHHLEIPIAMQGVMLIDATSRDEIEQRVRDYARDHPEESVILGHGWSAAVLGEVPTAAFLDELVPDRPAFLFEAWMHDGLFNSKAMQLAGVDESTPDPIPGYAFWLRDGNGKPTGMATEFTYGQTLIDISAWDARKIFRQGVDRIFTHASQSGVTAYCNMGLVTMAFLDADATARDTAVAFEILNELDKKDQLNLRTFINYSFKNPGTDVGRFIDSAKNLRSLFQTGNADRLRMQGIKVHPDGVLWTHSALMLEPYADRPDYAGETTFTTDILKSVVREGNQAGFDVHIHTGGDKMARMAVDAFEAVQNEHGKGERRNSIQHLAIVHPDDVDRIADLGIAVNTTPTWTTDMAGNIAIYREKLGEERMLTHVQPYRTLLDKGVSLSFAADAARNHMAPLNQIEAAVTRAEPGIANAPAFPPLEQAVILEEAIRAYTLEAAWQLRMEEKIGSLKPGKYADLVILGDNLFEVAPADIADVPIFATMMNGRYTWQAGGD